MFNSAMFFGRRDGSLIVDGVKHSVHVMEREAWSNSRLMQ